MTCPKCNFQNQEGRANCQECKQLLPVKHTFSFWKIGFFIELFLLVLFVVLIVVLTSDNMNLKLRVSTVVPQISQPSPTPTIYPQIASWKTYTNPEFGVTFQYPSDWEMDDSHGSLWVKHMSENCEHLDPITCQYYGFYIGPESVNPPPSTENANLYILESTLEYEKGLDKCMRDTNTSCWGERAIPGLAYLGKEETLFSKQTIFPAAEIGTINRMQGSNYQYYIINNKRLYLVELAAPDFQAGTNNPSFTDENHPIIKIIKTLKFL